MAKTRKKKEKAELEETTAAMQESGLKADDPKVKEYGEKYWEWQDTARKVLVAKELMELAGGYKEAFVLLDAIIFVATDEPKAGVHRAGGKADDAEAKEYGEKMEACEHSARTVLVAKKLIELAGRDEEAFLLLDAVMIAIEGEQGHEQAAEAHSSCAGHHEVMAASGETEGD